MCIPGTQKIYHKTGKTIIVTLHVFREKGGDDIKDQHNSFNLKVQIKMVLIHDKNKRAMMVLYRSTS